MAEAATGSVRLLGRASVPGTLSVGSTYYLAATPGAIASSAGTFSKAMGVADTASTLVMTVQQTISSTGNLVVNGTLQVTGVTTLDVQPILTSLTASQAVFSDGSKGLVSNAITGTGNVVMSASPTMTGTIGAAAMTLSTPLPVASGGTGIAAITANTVMLGAGTSDVTLLAPGTSGNVMTSNGTLWQSTAPTAGFEPLNICEGRLTLTSATPVTSADVSGATTLYWAPYAGNKVALYDGSSWSVSTFTQRSISLSGLTASKPYDVWVYDNSGTITLELLVWTNDTTRATALVLQDGVWCKTGALTRRYLGTLYVDSGGGAVTSTLAIRHLWNYYNRCPLPLFRMDTTNSWTYTTATWRQANASTANQFDFIIGVAEVPLNAELKVQGYNSSADVATYVGLGLDSTTAPTSGNFTTCNPASSPSAGQEFALSSAYSGYPAAGRHYLAWLENSTASGTMTWDGDAGGSKRNSGMTGVIDG